jgi:hypothetical protein
MHTEKNGKKETRARKENKIEGNRKVCLENVKFGSPISSK